MRWIRSILLCVAAVAMTGATRTQNFDNDPGWDGFNNRVEPSVSKKVEQDFGYRDTNIAGKDKGEIGGTIWRSSTPASYADKITPRTLHDKLTASGAFAITTILYAVVARAKVREAFGRVPRKLPVRPFAVEIGPEQWADDRREVDALFGRGAVTVIRLPLRAPVNA